MTTPEHFSEFSSFYVEFIEGTYWSALIHSCFQVPLSVKPWKTFLRGEP